ncbi:hypothetical protein U9M48_016757 [Paspalum notatum var. saurae]|uniref:Bifunctional inhibitor/plant lipid transfer protein/seed storage helical domain-containing protein n=1 Tax=Paspalum notatum var. saurae TaxID=547442 RepID=A0AAQ3T848_PASNO
MAGRTKVSSSAVAVAVAMAVALLLAAGEAARECNVDQGTVMSQCFAYCRGGGQGQGRPTKACCDALRHADFGCLCRKYGSQLRGSSCAMSVPSRCQIPGAPRSC